MLRPLKCKNSVKYDKNDEKKSSPESAFSNKDSDMSSLCFHTNSKETENISQYWIRIRSVVSSLKEIP